MSSPCLPKTIHAAFVLCCALSPMVAVAQVSRHVEVRLDSAAGQSHASGRLLVFAMPADEAEAAAKEGKVEVVNASPMTPEAVTIAALGLAYLAGGVPAGIEALRELFGRGKLDIDLLMVIAAVAAASVGAAR